jgi:hypothetical protein
MTIKFMTQLLRKGVSGQIGHFDTVFGSRKRPASLEQAIVQATLKLSHVVTRYLNLTLI